MFADDTTLIARSKRVLAIMLREVKEELGRIGLHLNPDKCFVQCSGVNNPSASHLTVHAEKYPICSCNAGFKVLGTRVTLNGNVSPEFEDRIRAAWGKFTSLSSVLQKRDASIFKRLRLFDTTVSKTILWCSESWKLTSEQKRKLRTTQRIMLRRIAGPRRKPDEDYVTWIRRATRKAENLAHEAGVKDWVKSYLQQKWKWAAKVVNMPQERWAKQTTLWRDHDWWREQKTSPHTTRARPGHFHRWENDFIKFAASKGYESWTQIAQNAGQWSALQEEFIIFTVR